MSFGALRRAGHAADCQGRAAVGLIAEALLAEDVQIPADGLVADAELFRHHADRNGFLPEQQIFDLRSTLKGKHKIPHFHNYFQKYITLFSEKQDIR